ncbi:hypothetical protein B0T13DRAFT_68108 [Neurospora crassa]|nr:hypothetical protein B0T13DRAFT_68108 [Neurospora crassa]
MLAIHKGTWTYKVMFVPITSASKAPCDQEDISSCALILLFTQVFLVMCRVLQKVHVMRAKGGVHNLLNWRTES